MGEPPTPTAHRSVALLADDPLAPYTWLTRLERVRPALERFTMPYTLAHIRTSLISWLFGVAPTSGT